MIIQIHDLQDPHLDVYARIGENQLRHLNEPGPGVFIAESPKVISRAMDAGYEPVSFLVEDRHIEGEAREVLARSECSAVPIFTAGYEVLTGLTGYALTRGMLCCMKRKPFPPPSAVCGNAKRIAVLERVMNPTNVGAIFRSAAAMGMDAVLLTPDCSDPLYRRAARVSMGTVFQIPWTILPKPDNDCQSRGHQTLPQQLRQLGFAAAAMALSDRAVGITDPRLRAEERLAVILGSEGDGLAAETLDTCDYVVRIPMREGVDSLNVAAASAVAFWEMRKEQVYTDKGET